MKVVAREDKDFSDTLKRYFGKMGWYTHIVMFIAMLTIPMILNT
jgi:hypothetical protein